MKELIVQHLPVAAGSAQRVRVRFRLSPHAPPEAREAEFHFKFSAEQRAEVKWYWEEYLLSPWAANQTRAQQAEALIQELGAHLFTAVFGHPETSALYDLVADDLPHTRMLIEAETAPGQAIPWEFLRDPARGDYGEIARVVQGFARGASGQDFPDDPPRKVETTFNVLLVTAAIPTETASTARRIRRSLFELMRAQRERVKMDVIRPASWAALTERITEKAGYYHVLHFDGFALTLPSEPTARILLGSPGSQDHEVETKQLAGLLNQGQIPMLFIDAAPLTETNLAALNMLGQQLTLARVPGVVALPVALPLKTRLRFWARLYEGLINGEELSSAIVRARADLHANPQRFSPIGELPIRDWMAPELWQAAPVCFVGQPFRPIRLNPAALLDQSAKASAELDCPQLPLFGFIGRDAILSKLEQAFDTHTFVQISGPAGIGKTETALAFARWCAESAGLNGPILYFPCQLYVSLIQICDCVGQMFQEDIKIRQHKEWPRLDRQQRIVAALAVLQQSPALLILDDVESITSGSADNSSAGTDAEQRELREFLAALDDGQTRVLFTSRRPESWLGSPSYVIQLPGMALAESQELAARILSKAGLNSRQLKALPPYNDVLVYLHGNPLALQIILPELRRTAPENLLSGLRRQSEPAAAGHPDSADRICAWAIEYRRAVLDPVLRRRLGIVGLFRGFVAARVLAALSCLPDAPPLLRDFGREDWIRVLDAAADMGLLRRVDEGPYLIPPALEPYFQALLHEVFGDQLDWLEQQYCAICGRAGNQLFQIHQANPQFALSLLRLEQYNLMRAFRLARQRQDWDNLKEILCGLRALWLAQGRWSEWEYLIADLEAETNGLRPEASPAAEILWFRLLGHRAEICEYRRDFAYLQGLHKNLKEHYGCAGASDKQADVLDDLGAIAEQRRHFEEASRFYLKSVAVKQKFGDQSGQAATLLRLGDLALAQRHFRPAQKWYQEALAIWQQIGDADNQATTCCRLGAVGQERADFEEAEQWYQRSLEIRARLGDEPRQALALHQLGRMAHERREYDMAGARYQQSLSLRQRLGDLQGQAATLHQMGRLARDQKNYAMAERHFAAALQLREKHADEPGQAQTIHQLGNVAFLQGHYDQAEALYKRSLQLREHLHDMHGQARNLNQLAKLAVAQGDQALASQYYQRAEALFAQLKDPFGGLRSGAAERG